MPCKRCGGALYRQVDYCPYCGAVHPLDDTPYPQDSAPHVHPLHTPLRTLEHAPALPADDPAARSARIDAAIAREAEARETARRTSIVSAGASGVAGVAGAGMAGVAGPQAAAAYDEPPFPPYSKAQTGRNIALGIAALFLLALTYVLYVLFSDNVDADDIGEHSAIAAADARSTTGAIEPFANGRSNQSAARHTPATNATGHATLAATKPGPLETGATATQHTDGKPAQSAQAAPPAQASAQPSAAAAATATQAATQGGTTASTQNAPRQATPAPAVAPTVATAAATPPATASSAPNSAPNNAPNSAQNNAPTLAAASPAPAPLPAMPVAPARPALHFSDASQALQAARGAFRANDLSTAQAALAAAQSLQPGNADTQHFADELRPVAVRRDNALQAAQSCVAQQAWPCARQHANEALAIDTGNDAAKLILERVIRETGWAPLPPHANATPTPTPTPTPNASTTPAPAESTPQQARADHPAALANGSTIIAAVRQRATATPGWHRAQPSRVSASDSAAATN